MSLRRAGGGSWPPSWGLWGGVAKIMSTDWAGSAFIIALQSPRMIESSGSAGVASGVVRARTLSSTAIVQKPLSWTGKRAERRRSVKHSLVNEFGCQIVNEAEHFATAGRC